MQRRDLFKTMLAGAVVGAGAGTSPALFAQSASKGSPNGMSSGAADREYMSGLLYKIAQPVLSNMAQGKLRERFQMELSPLWDGRNKEVAYMEAFGRLASGVAPWLTLPEDDAVEGKRRKAIEQWTLQSYVHAVDPKSPDYLLWRTEWQPLVDSAFFTGALLRAPKQLWEPLDKTTKTRIIQEIKGLRRIPPAYTNWVLFAAMNEVFLMSIGEEFDPMRIDVAVRKMNEWYVGDGWFSDGERFHMDYYNSYVIHPMMLTILDTVTKFGPSWWKDSFQALYEQQLKRIQRHCEYLERIISPEGTFPPFGRSLTYRTGAFQPLALMAWRKQLPATITEGQVRAAMTALHRRVFSDPTNFSSENYLTLGFVGHQPAIVDPYSNSGSMYLTTESFLALGLPATDSYWTSAPEKWTAKKAFGNEAFKRDYAVKY
jgi:hypothetical protein